MQRPYQLFPAFGRKGPMRLFKRAGIRTRREGVKRALSWVGHHSLNLFAITFTAQRKAPSST